MIKDIASAQKMGFGVFRNMLLSRNFPPSEDLQPAIRRHYVYEAALPEDFVVTDRLLSETGFVRVLLRGDWEAEVAPGYWMSTGRAVLFGPNARSLPVRIRGPILIAGFAIRPSAWCCLFPRPARDYADTVLPLSAAWGDSAETLLHDLDAAPCDAAMVAAMERAVRAQLDRNGPCHPDLKMAIFETIARTGSTARIDDIATQLGLSVRQLERRCLKAFGLSPKAVLRRSRFLDMATAMRGFSSPSEEELAKLCYFDQSHLNREFRRFAGMTPGAFLQTGTPLFTAGLDLRNQGKALP